MTSNTRLLQGDQLNFNNNYNLYDYFINVTLNQNDVLQKPAIIYKDKIITYDELNKRITKIRNHIQKTLKEKINFDIEQAENNQFIVGVHLVPDDNLIPTLLAVHSLSMSYLPLDPQLPKRLQYIIQNADPLCILSNINASLSLEDNLKEINKYTPIIKIIDTKDNGSFIEPKQLVLKANKTAVVLYTSGSTGVPKGVCLSHSTIMNRLNWQWQQFPLIQSRDIGALKTTLNFVDHIAEIFAFILKCHPIVVADQDIVQNVPKFIDLIFNNKITYLIVVPLFLKTILSYVKLSGTHEKLFSIKRWVTSGDVLTIDLVDMFFDIAANDAVLSNFYGSTEVMGDVTFITFNSKEEAHNLLFNGIHVPIGRPISNNTIELSEEQDSVDEIVREITVYGQNLADGYLNYSKIESGFIEADDKRVFRTGDYGLIHNKLLYYMGRHDSQVKIRGKRVELSELQHYARKINGIDEFIPLVYEDDKTKMIIAFYKSKLAISDNNIVKLINEELSKFVFDYMLPTQMIKLTETPLLFNGKIDKQSLLKLYETKYRNDVSHDSTNIKEKIFNVIENVTHVPILDQNLNFGLKEYGINSLNAVELYFALDSLNFTFDEFLSFKTLNELIENCELRLCRQDTVCSGDKYSFYQDTNFGKNLKISRQFDEDLYLKIITMGANLLALKSEIYIASGHTAEDSLNAYKDSFDYFRSTESFVVINTENNEIVGGSILEDVLAEIKVNAELIFPLIEFMEAAEMSVIEKLLSEGKRVLHSFFNITDPKLTTLETIILQDFIETKVIEIALERNYDVIVTSNVSKLTNDLCINQKGYVLEKVFKAKDFTIEGKKYFTNVSDDSGAYVCVKYLQKT